jgi:hypothetical protein
VTRLQPQHDAPTCAHCQCQTVTPLDLRCSLLGFRCNDMRRLFCPACGHDYTEAGDQRVARAWWSAGAYAGAEEVRETEVVGARKAALTEAADLAYAAAAAISEAHGRDMPVEAAHPLEVLASRLLEMASKVSP